MSQVDVLRADRSRLEAVAGLFDAYRQFYGQAPDLDGARQFLSARLDNSDSVLLLAVAGPAPEGPALGFAQLYPSFSSVRMKPLWILNDLFVAPSARGRGVGRRLLEAAAELARATGACRVVLATARDNAPAKALYEAMGYRRDEQFDHYELVIESTGSVGPGLPGIKPS